jgi:hypothetical protein
MNFNEAFVRRVVELEGWRRVYWGITMEREPEEGSCEEVRVVRREDMVEWMKVGKYVCVRDRERKNWWSERFTELFLEG